MFVWIVSASEMGSKLLHFLSMRLEGKYSARFLKKAIERNCCEINGRAERFASAVLGTGDRVCFYAEQVHSMVEGSAPPQIIFEDDALLILNKPAGMTCDERGVLKVLKERASSVQLVHRLDKETTGVLIFAKNKAIFNDFVQQFKHFQVEKHYLTIVDGVVEQLKGVIENYLGTIDSYAGQTMQGSVSAEKGLYASTEWRLIKKGKRASMLACTPKTGRTHQIRVHMAEMKHPILGDYQYGKHFLCPYRPPRYLLHAESIVFFHPMTRERMQFSAPLPDDFRACLQVLMP